MRRNAVTLLEVLFSIGIVAIGLLGVLVAITVAGRTAADGRSADAAASLGRAATQMVVTRGFNRAVGSNGTWAAVAQNGQAYCLDPLYVSKNGSASPDCYFPALDPSVVAGPRMNRISVRPFPGDQQAAPVAPIGYEMSELLCLCHDDLVFIHPEDRTLPPRQNYGATSLVRQSVGEFSWFATIEADSYKGGTGRLNIAILQARNLDDEDRLLDVVPVPATAAGNESLKIAVRNGQPTTELDIKERHWVLLTGIDEAGHARFGWFRVSAVAGVIPAGQPDTSLPSGSPGYAWPEDSRWISGFCRDWLCTPDKTKVAVVGPVVAVLERVIRMGE